MLLNATTDSMLPYSMKGQTFNCSDEARMLVDTPLDELSAETRVKLSEMLNGRKILRYAGHDRDWRGLAELAKVRNFCNSNSDDPMQTVLSQWCQRNGKKATCFHLLHYLSKIDRWDVSDDIFVFLLKDAQTFVSKRLHVNSTDNATDGGASSYTYNEYVVEAVDGNNDEQNQLEEYNDNQNNDMDNDDVDDGGSHSSSSSPPSPPTSTPPNVESLIGRVELLTKASTTTHAIPTVPNAPITVAVYPTEPAPEVYNDEINPLTCQDAARLRRGLPLTKYDAFVLYADPDQHYANEMQLKLEKYTEFNFELVFKNRDLLGGTFFHDAVAELMENRCNYVLLIVTKNFSNDFESCFFYNNAQTWQLKENRRKIIPLLYDLYLPRALRGLHTLKYQSEHFWDLLVDSLSVKLPPLLIKVPESKTNEQALSNLPKPPNTPIVTDEKELKKKTTAVKKSLLKKPGWIKKKKIQK
ncbi:uncharacterized protein [Eurosta solidaginis]|uniref:uncharacterized protein isoform X2 n=1 Tax=Eurosta solidaginis TaxID=178769 RepID=UPI0035312C69